MNDTYPKFQWSVFVKNGRDQQYVVRADTADELFEGQKQIFARIGEEAVTTTPAPTATTEAPATENTKRIIYKTICKTCKAPAMQKSGVSKQGKEYNAIFCSTEDRSHTIWL